jgi:DNA-binding beta-propeller fold protein YncE/DNA-directed RNA polymerase subunit RPC12/RpoP
MNQTFNCPNCGAPLDYQGSDPIIRCPYCNGSVIVPENLRAKPTFSNKPSNFTLSGSGDRGGLINQARRIKQVKDLAEAGETEQAVALYREITGTDEFAARKAVGALATGQPVIFSSAPVTSLPAKSVIQVDANTSAKIGRGLGCFFAFLIASIAASLIIPLLGSLGVFAMIFGNLKNSGIPVVPSSQPAVEIPRLTAFASQELTFGGEGTGPGLFGDVRAIGVNPVNGNIYAANYDDGRVQVFDAQGKFITQWIISKEQTDPYFGDLAVGRDGTVYIPVYGRIMRFDEHGQSLGDFKVEGRISNLDITPDGTLVVVANGEDILWISPEGKVLQSVRAAVSGITADPELDSVVAVDGLGNVYLLGTFNNAVLVYNSQGTYINRFGSAGEEPGQFRAPQAIEVDGKGRVFVSDIKGVQVFSSDGRYLDVFKVQYVAYGLAFDDQGKLYVTTNQKKIEKYSLKE